MGRSVFLCVVEILLWFSWQSIMGRSAFVIVDTQPDTLEKSGVLL
jgi:hypothetical protein